MESVESSRKCFQHYFASARYWHINSFNIIEKTSTSKSEVWSYLTLCFGGSGQFLFAQAILLECSHESSLVGRCLETSMTQFGWCINEFQVNVLQSNTLNVHQSWLSQSDDTLLGSNTTSLNHDEVVVDFSVEWITSHWCNWFVSDVIISWGIVLNDLQVK